MNTKDINYATTTNILYVIGLTELIQKICRHYNVRVVFNSTTRLGDLTRVGLLQEKNLTKRLHL